MKPKLRTQQRQTSRLYFRGKDHREFIMNDMYHNGIWMKKRNGREDDEDAPIIDELIWWKYPHESLLTSTGNLSTFGWMDTDRQFQHQVLGVTGQRSGAIYKFDGFVVFWNGYTSIDYIRVTEDGCFWKAIDMTVPPNVPVKCQKYAINSLCNVSGSTLYVTDFIKDFDADIYRMETRTIDLLQNLTYLCPSYNGCYCGRVEQYTDASNKPRFKLYIYLVTDDGVTFKHMEENLPINPFDGRIRGCCFGLQSTFCFNGTYRMYWDGRYDYDTFVSCVYAFGSTNGLDWTVEPVISWSSGERWQESYGNYNKFDAFVRSGQIYVLCSSGINKETMLYHFTGSSFDSISLPFWTEVQVLSEGGMCVGIPSWGETVKIGLKQNPDVEGGISVDFWLYDILRVTYGGDLTPDLNNGQCNIRVVDGEIKDADDFMLLGIGSTKVYFDNLQFIASSKSFAYVTKEINESDGIETIQDNDYVVR